MSPSIGKADRIMERTENQFGNISGLFVAGMLDFALLFLIRAQALSCDIDRNPIETAVFNPVGAWRSLVAHLLWEKQRTLDQSPDIADLFPAG